MKNRILVQYIKSLDLIEEGDVLLFRGGGLVSRLIQRAGEGTYSHVGLATWHNCRKVDRGYPLLEVTEFREWYGGRTINLWTAYRDSLKAECIDVYRATRPLQKITFNPETHTVEQKEILFDGKAVTNRMRQITGLPYGWQRISWIMQHKLALTRWFYNTSDIADDTLPFEPERIYPVCSTAVAACYSSIGYDLVPNRSDEWMEPSDVSRSAHLNYLFTLTL